MSNAWHEMKHHRVDAIQLVLSNLIQHKGWHEYINQASVETIT